MTSFIKLIFIEHLDTLKSFKWRFIQIFLKQFTAFVIFLLSLSFLSVEEFGLYSYIVALIFFLTMFCDFGISTAATKYASEYLNSDSNKFNALLFTISFLIFILSALVLVITLVFGRSYLDDKFIFILYLLPMLFTVPVLSLYDGVYRSLKLYKKLAFYSLFVAIFSICCSWFLIKEFDLIGSLVAQNIFFVTLLVFLIFDYKKFPFEFNLSVFNEVGKYSFYIGLSVIGYYLFSRIDIILLGHFGFYEQIATLEVFNKFYLLALLPLQILSQVLFTNFAEYASNKEFKKILLKFRYYSFFSLAISVIFFVVSFTIMPILLSLFFPSYSGNVAREIILPITLTYAVIIYGLIINSAIITATGYARLMMYLNLVIGPISIFLGMYSITYFGYIGVLYSNLILNFLAVVILHYMFVRKVKLISL